MSSTGILIVIVGIFIIFNFDNLAHVLMGDYQLNVTGFADTTHHTNPGKN